MGTTPFVNNAEDYKRDFDILSNFRDDAAMYFSKVTGDSIEKTREWVSTQMRPGGKFEIKDPQALVLTRGENGDREPVNSTFATFLKETIEERSLCSPSLTTFLHPDEKQSLLSGYVETNMALRSADKSDGQQAKMEGDRVRAEFKQVLQTSRKVKNNSLSGAHSSKGTPLFNKSTHPTLTSTCRCATSYANANNERFLSGARHYWRPDIALNNIVSVVNNSDLTTIEETMKTLGLKYPEVSEVMDVVHFSTKHYWNIPDYMARIEELVKSLTPLERAAYLYTQDFSSLAKLNPDFIRKMLLDFAEVKDTPIENPDQYIEKLDEDLSMLVCILTAEHLGGMQLKKVKAEHPDKYAIVAHTAKNVLEMLDRYALVITTFWRTNNPPPSIAMFPNAIRNTVVVSDTDSTIFTVAPWVEWTYGELLMDQKGLGIAAVMVYFASMTLVHVLAGYSANMGIVPERIFQLAMKNEYMMESLILTGKGKHYTYRIIAEEGNVYPEPKLDIKGVSLRNSKVPPQIMKGVRSLINDVMDDVRDKGSVKLRDYLVRCADIERSIRDSFKRGSSEYLTYNRIMPRETYTKPDSSNYFYYDLWQEVFAQKYGPITELPCPMVKVSLETSNRTILTRWINSFEDKGMAERLDSFLIARKRRDMKMILVPAAIVKSHGIPEEIMSASDVRLIIYTTMEAYYLLMESLGYYCKNDNNTRLLSDDF